MRFYHGGKLFNVKNGAAEIIENSSPYSFEAERVISNEISQENIWDNRPITLNIYANKNGIGFEHEIPGGYSEYTYDPDTTRGFYYTNDLDWLLRFALDTDQREMLSANDLTTIRNALDRLQK